MQIIFWVLAAVLAFGAAWTIVQPGRGTVPARALLVVLAGVPLAAMGLYLAIGAAGQGDTPLAARLAAPLESLPLPAVIARLDMQLRDEPDDGAAWQLMARARESQGAHARAIDAWQRHIEIDGPSAEAYTALAENLISQDGGIIATPAFDLLRAAAALAPDRPDTVYLLGLALLQQGDRAAAREQWQRLYALLPDGLPLKVILEGQIAALGETAQSATK